MSYQLDRAILIVEEGEICCLDCLESKGIEPSESSHLVSEGGDYIDRCSICHSRQPDVELTDEGLLYETRNLIGFLLRTLDTEPFDGTEFSKPAFHWFEGKSPTNLDFAEDTREALERCWGYYSHREPLEWMSGPVESILKALWKALKDSEWDRVKTLCQALSVLVGSE